MTTDTLIPDQEVSADDLETLALVEKMKDAHDPKKAMLGRVMPDPEHVGQDGIDKDVRRPVVTTIEGGYSELYRTDTGEKIVVDKTLAPNHLRKRYPDWHPDSKIRGKRVFSPTDPGITPIINKVKCLLHIDHPSRDKWAEMGFASCGKSNMPNEFELRSHMETLHSKEWKAMELQREKSEKEAERDFQRNLIAGSAAAQMLTDKDRSDTLVSTTCSFDGCKQVLLAKSPAGLSKKLQAHNRKAH